VDVEPDRRLDAPIFLGLVIEDLNVPTVDLGDGAVARIHIENEAIGNMGIPSPVANVQLAADNIAWDANPAAGSYDVVFGGLKALRANAGDFSGSLLGCVVNNSPFAGAVHPAAPPIGDGFYYLVRANAFDGSDGSYDGADGTQVGRRDEEIAASPVACP
jgi:hypothetical protein